MPVFNSLFPVFAIIALGIGLARIGFIDEPLQKGLNRLAFYVGLPVLLFHKISAADLAGSSAGDMFWTLLFSTVLCVVLALAISSILKLPRLTRGAMIQASFRGNQGFVALFVIINMLAGMPISEAARQSVEAGVSLALAPTIILYNLIAVTVLVVYGPPSDRPFFRETGVKLAKNPLIIGCVLGLAWNVFGLPIPVAMERSCDAVGRAAFPIALLGIGAQLTRTRIGASLQPALVSAAIKNAVAPMIGYVVGRGLFGLEGAELAACLIMHATPTAVASYILADQMESDSAMAATAVAVSTGVSLVGFAVVLFLFV